jgi:hypothetical protein
VKDLSVHRSTARLFERAASGRHNPRTSQRATTTLRVFLALLASLSVAAFFGPPLVAQGTSTRKPLKKTAAKPKRTAAADDAMPTGSAKPAAKPAPAKSDDSGDDSPAADQSSDVFSISKPLTTDEAWKVWNEGRQHGDYNTRVHGGELDRDAMQVISKGIEMQIKAMTLPTQRDRLGEIVAGILRSLHSAADSKDPGTQRSVRLTMAREIDKDCRELADNQFNVRLNATILLGHLFVVPENPVSHAPPEFYTAAFDQLMDILQRKDQPVAIKVAAIDGLQNAALLGNPPLGATQKIHMATALRDELDKTDTCEWYQEKICETLGLLNQVYDLDGRPFIVHALAKALFDQNRPLCARAAAAKALGRAPLPPAIDLNVVAYGIADLSRQIVQTRNEGKKHVRRWCVMNVFLAFRPKNLEERARRAGLLERVDEPAYQRYKETVKDVYGLVLPMVVQELKETDSEFPPEILEHITEWLKTHTPAQLRVVPGLPPITTTQVTKSSP